MTIDSIKPSPAKVGEDITVSGTITPQDFENTIQKKQIVLVIDISGSMGGAKIANLQTAAKNFVTKMSTVSNTEIAIVAFSDQGIINPNLSGYSDGFVSLNSSNVANSNNITLVKNSIDSLRANGATNTGDGLRNAAYLLSKSKDLASSKTIVFMSDGQPTKYELNKTKSWALGTYTGYYVSDSSGNKYAWDWNNLPQGYNWGFDYKLGEYYLYDSSGNKYNWDGNNLPQGYYWGYDKVRGYYVSDSSGNKYAWNGNNSHQGYYWSYGTFDGYKYTNSYYTDITRSVFDSTSVSSGGTGYDDQDGMCLGYAKTIGKIIKDNGYNVFSIGYGLDSSSGDDAKMKSIHSSMSDNPNNYYATDTGAIDGVYNTIADKIINSYTLNNITMNLNLSTNFTLNYGGNIVNIQNVTYSKRTDITDRIVYHAEPIPFQFTIKGSKQVTDYNVLQGATLIVPWNGGNITDTIMPVAKVTIIENNLPNIKVNLSKVNDQTYNQNQVPVVIPGKPIKVTYQIATDQFEYNINNSAGGMIDEAVFVADLSQNMGSGNRWQIMQNWFTNILLNDTQNINNIQTDNTLKNQNIKFGVVGYDEDVVHPIYNGSYDKLFNRADLTDRETLRKLLQEPNSTQHEAIYPESNTSRNIGSALRKADYLLQFKGESNKNKAIVLVNSGGVNYSQSDIDAIKNKGYKIISVDLSCDKNQNTISNLKALHSNLLGNDNDYFVSGNDGDNFNFTQVEMQEIADRLKAGITQKKLTVTDAKLNFDLGENFEADSNSGLDGSGSIRTVTLPDINYTLVKDDQGNYKWTQNDPNPIEVSFYVKPISGKIDRKSVV